MPTTQIEQQSEAFAAIDRNVASYKQLVNTPNANLTAELDAPDALTCGDCDTVHHLNPQTDNVVVAEHQRPDGADATPDDMCSGCEPVSDVVVIDDDGNRIGSDDAYELVQVYDDELLERLDTEGVPPEASGSIDAEAVADARRLINEYDIRSWADGPGREYRIDNQMLRRQLDRGRRAVGA